MSVYVDDMKAQFGRMIMCHMMADTSLELEAMAKKIGVANKWKQKQAKPEEHFDICMAKKALALAAGAIQIDSRKMVDLIRAKRLSFRVPKGQKKS